MRHSVNRKQSTNEPSPKKHRDKKDGKSSCADARYAGDVSLPGVVDCLVRKRMPQAVITNPALDRSKKEDGT